jgi:hypothetical protein
MPQGASTAWLVKGALSQSSAGLMDIELTEGSFKLAVGDFKF